MTALPAIHTLTPAHVGLPIRIQDAGLDVTGILVRLDADSTEDQPMLGVAPRHVPLAPEATLAVAGGAVTVRLNPATIVELQEARP